VLCVCLCVCLCACVHTLNTECSTQLLTYLTVLIVQSDNKFNISYYFRFTAKKNIF
jgi:hypothetical protein